MLVGLYNILFCRKIYVILIFTTASCFGIQIFIFLYYKIITIFQEAYFTWACGVREPGCYFALDVKTKKSIVFVPRLPDEYEIWMGKLLSCQDYTNMYGVDEVRYVDEVYIFFT